MAGPISELGAARGNAAGYQVIIPAAGCSRRMSHLTGERPKSLLEVEGRSIIAHSLETLNAFGFRHATFVVGYRRARLMAALGERYREIAIEYVVNEAYASSEHGWSLFLTRASWERSRRPVLFMDADNLYDPEMLRRLMRCPDPDVMLVDETFVASERDEELVCGRDGRVERLVRGRSDRVERYAGAFVGINRFSPAFMARLYRFMEAFFAPGDRNFKYERVFDAFIAATAARIRYLPIGGLPWININHEDEYRAASAIAARMAAVARAVGEE